ncbi:MFS transporter [Longispora sp. NPDC051575]|uniref:MFS transporter n=1 Tax=Longispora sp. NPDC051575 TaxID=3154943 RepID=UPI00341C7628
MAQTLAPHVAHRTPDPRRWKALTLLSVAQFMLILDVTVVQVALPSMGVDLSLGRQALTWVVTTYTLAFGGLMLFGGRLADLFGARRILLVGLALFTLASLGATFAPDGVTLIAGRAAQGVGAALLSPAALAIVSTTFVGPERHKALGVWAGIGGMGAAIGVLLGGLLTAGPGWEWVFGINVPVGIVVFALLLRVVPANRVAAARTGVDLPGAIAVTAAVSALIYGLVTAGDSGWDSPQTLIPLGAGLVLVGVFAAIERTSAAPLMRVQMLTRRPVLAGAFLMLVATGLLIAFFFLGSLYLQQARGFGPLKTGLMFLPAAVAIGAGAHLGGRLIGRIGARPVAAGGLLISAGGAFLLTQIGVTGTAYATFLPGLAVAAFGVGPVFVAATTSALAHVKHHEAGLASGVVNTFHELGGAVGVAVASTIAAVSIGSTIPQAVGFVDAYAVSTVVAIVAAGIAVGLVPPGKAVITGGPHVH